jgi:hypothetical protein
MTLSAFRPAVIRSAIARSTIFALAVFSTLAGSQNLAAQEKLKASAPVLVTSLGQSLDAFQVQLAVRRAGIAFKYDARAEPDLLAEVKTLFLVVGASLKGFGEAGITIKDELARAGQLLDAAKSRSIPLSNQLIELTAPRAQYLIIRNDSDSDGMFTNIAKAGKIPLTSVENVINLRGPLQELFAGS